MSSETSSLTADPPRVAHLLRPAAGGMREVARALLAAGPSLLAAPPEVLASLTDVVPAPLDRYALTVGPSPGARTLLRDGAAAGRWARGRGAVLLHGHGLRLAPLFAAAAAASGLPLVVTLHNLVPAPLSPPVRLLLRAALGRARRVIAVSGAVAESARGVVPAGRLIVIPNGVDTARFAAGALPPRPEARAALGLDPSDPMALCVARLSPEKDVASFLEAAALLTPLLPSARFLVAGEGPLLPTLAHQIQHLRLEKRAALLGRREDIPTLLAAADLLCLPSREEGLGLAALEAMAAGVPVVATRVGGLPEAVEEGVTGLLVAPGDPAALAAALTALLSDPPRARMLGAAGRRRADERYTRERMLRTTFAVYAEARRR